MERSKANPALGRSAPSSGSNSSPNPPLPARYVRTTSSAPACGARSDETNRRLQWKLPSRTLRSPRTLRDCRRHRSSGIFLVCLAAAYSVSKRNRECAPPRLPRTTSRSPYPRTDAPSSQRHSSAFLRSPEKPLQVRPALAPLSPGRAKRVRNQAGSMLRINSNCIPSLASFFSSSVLLPRYYFSSQTSIIAALPSAATHQRSP